MFKTRPFASPRSLRERARGPVFVFAAAAFAGTPAYASWLDGAPPEGPSTEAERDERDGSPPTTGTPTTETPPTENGPEASAGEDLGPRVPAAAGGRPLRPDAPGRPAPPKLELDDDLADHTAPDAELLGLDEAIELALANHPAIRNAKHQTEASKARVGQAQANYYPQIDGWLQYLRGTENGSVTSIHGMPGVPRVGGNTPDGVDALDSFNNYVAALVLRQLIWDFGRTKGNVDAQKAIEQMAQVNEELVKQTVIFGVMQAYYDVWAARANIDLARENEKTALAILELADAAFRAGLKPESEPARAQATVASARVAIIRAEAQLDIARARVANAVGLVQGNYEPTGYALDPGTVETEQALIDTALANRPELGVLGYQRDSLAHSLRSVRGQQLPRIDALMGMNTRGQFLTGSGQEPFNVFNGSVAVMVNVPLFQGLRVRKQKQEVRAQMSAVDERAEMVRQSVVLEVRRALAMVEAADAAEQASAEGVAAALKAVEVLEGRYPEGLTKLVELTDAQQAYINARAQQVRATYDRFLARAALSIAIGKPSG